MVRGGCGRGLGGCGRSLGGCGRGVGGPAGGGAGAARAEGVSPALPLRADQRRRLVAF